MLDLEGAHGSRAPRVIASAIRMAASSGWTRRRTAALASFPSTRPGQPEDLAGLGRGGEPVIRPQVTDPPAEPDRRLGLLKEGVLIAQSIACAALL